MLPAWVRSGGSYALAFGLVRVKPSLRARWFERSVVATACAPPVLRYKRDIYAHTRTYFRSMLAMPHSALP